MHGDGTKSESLRVVLFEVGGKEGVRQISNRMCQQMIWTGLPISQVMRWILDGHNPRRDLLFVQQITETTGDLVQMILKEPATSCPQKRSPQRAITYLEIIEEDASQSILDV